jgi:hypothetical protein
VDAEGNRTGDPAEAVGGEIVERAEQDGPARRTWFSVKEVELSWLPVSEAAFLLWVLAALVFVWLVATVILYLL